MKWIYIILIIGVLLISGIYTFGKTDIIKSFNSTNERISNELKGITLNAGELTTSRIEYEDNNMTAVLMKGENIIGKTTLKSHKTYDEVLKVPSGNEVMVIYYYFYDFPLTKTNYIKSVEFIDMREYIANYSNERDSEKYNIIKNPNYNKSVNKDYKLVYLEKGKWIRYDAGDIPLSNITIGVMTNMYFGELIDVRMNISGNTLDRHAVVLGTDAGFVTTAPTGTPTGSPTTFDTQAIAIRDVAPVGATTITEMGWWSNAVTEDAETYVGIYSNNASGRPDVLLGSINFSKGTTAGWKSTSLNVAVAAGTTYWLAYQLDDTVTASKAVYTDLINYGQIKTAQTYLPNPWGTSGSNTTRLYAVYAVYTNATGGNCTYTSGNWAINCADNCVISSNSTLNSNSNVSLTGTGNLNISSGVGFCFNSTGQYITIASGCTVYIASGGFLSQGTNCGGMPN